MAYSKRREIVMLNLVVLIISVIFKGSDGFDYFKLVQQWPPAFCSAHPDECNQAIANATHRFTIHGFWPALDDGSELIDCDPQDRFNETLIETLKEGLEREWPSLKTGWTDLRFWSHEWKMHGTCSNGYFNQFQYFDAALRIKQLPSNDIYQILKNKNLAPTATSSQTVNVLDLSNAIFYQLDHLPAFHCERNPNTNQWLITEIILCFDPSGVSSLVLRNCSDHDTVGCLPGRPYRWSTFRGYDAGELKAAGTFRPRYSLGVVSWGLISVSVSVFLYVVRERLFKMKTFMFGRTAQVAEKED